MTPLMNVAAALVVLAWAVAPGAARAGDLGVLETQRLGQIEFMSGGVGEGERAQIRALAPEYNLKVVTSGPSGAYVAGLDITLFDEQGTRILSTRTQGPLFYARLPAGRYTLTATDGSDVQQRTIVVGTAASPELLIAIGKPAPAATGGASTYSERVPTSRSTASGAVNRARVQDRGLSLYDLDPSAADRAKTQVQRYAVYPDGTTRPLAPGESVETLSRDADDASGVRDEPLGATPAAPVAPRGDVEPAAAPGRQNW